MPPANKPAAAPALPDPPAAAAEGKMPTPAEQATMAVTRENAAAPPIEAEDLMTDRALALLGLTDEQLAKGVKVYIVKKAFTLTWDSHHRIQFRQGIMKIPVIIAEHWYCNPSPDMQRVVEA
jgi:hypothetical protein